MNIALPALALLLLALPGFLLTYTYKGSLRPQDEALVSSASMSMGWVLSLLVAGIAHAIWVPAADYYLRHWGSGTRVDLGSVLFLLAGEYKDPKTQTCLYAGLLKSYEFSADGEIKRLTLEFAQRAEFSGNIEAITKFVAIPGDRFVIWCRDVNTLNVQYVTVDVAKDGSGASHQKELPLTLNP